MPVSRGAILDDSGETIKLVNIGDPAIPYVEIPGDVLLTYTNCTRQDWALSLLEMSIAAGALSVLVFTSDYWKGGARGIPLIDTEVILCFLFDSVEFLTLSTGPSRSPTDANGVRG